MNTAAQDEQRFTAYKVYIANGNQDRGGHVRNLTLEEVRDEVRFPLGPQHDERGAFIWSYGINDGQLT